MISTKSHKLAKLNFTTKLQFNNDFNDLYIASILLILKTKFCYNCYADYLVLQKNNVFNNVFVLPFTKIFNQEADDPCECI